MTDKLIHKAADLLQRLIALPSISGDEDKTARTIQSFFESHDVKCHLLFNNIYAFNEDFQKDKPTLLLNSHHDTVKPNVSWIRDPFTPEINNGKLYGLGSNDAGASLVSLIGVFLHFYKERNLSHNLVLAVTAEEESSGEKGIRSVLPELGAIDLAIVGEPTGMEMAVAEKGLVVLRCEAHGKSGHAARNIGDNAILKAIEDIRWFSSYHFTKESVSLGPVKMSVTMIESGTQHNVIPDLCKFTVDIRTVDTYSHEEILEIIRENTKSSFSEPSLNLSPSSISMEHPLVKAAAEVGVGTFGSPTLSDQTFIPVPSVKIGPGMSERSHTADEFIYLAEIEQGITIYNKLLTCFLLS